MVDNPVIFAECSFQGPLHNMPLIWHRFANEDWYRYPSCIDCFGNAVVVDFDKVRIFVSNTAKDGPPRASGSWR